jgi:hypothetical protein
MLLLEVIDGYTIGSREFEVCQTVLVSLEDVERFLDLGVHVDSRRRGVV